MSEPQRLGKYLKSRRWVGWASGFAALILVIAAIAIGGRQSPSSHLAPAAANSLSEIPVTRESTRAPILPTSTAAPAATSVPTRTPLPVDTAASTAPLVPTQALLPTATSTAVPSPVPTAARRAALRPTATIQPTPAATMEPLNFSFIASAYCISRKQQTVSLLITAHGGQPPYDYFNDTTPIGQSVDGSVTYALTTAAGNQVPYKIIIVDSAGQRVSEDFFYKTGLRCAY